MGPALRKWHCSENGHEANKCNQIHQDHIKGAMEETPTNLQINLTCPDTFMGERTSWVQRHLSHFFLVLSFLVMYLYIRRPSKNAELQSNCNFFLLVWNLGICEEERSSTTNRLKEHTFCTYSFESPTQATPTTVIILRLWVIILWKIVTVLPT